MKKAISSLYVLAFIVVLVLAGCGSKAQTDSSSSPAAASPAASSPASVEPSASQPAATAGEDITVNLNLPDNDTSPGPNGETPVSAKDLKLTPEDVEKIKAGNYTAAIVMHYMGNEWSDAQVKGLTETFNKMGIKVVAVTDGQQKPEKQASDIETVLAKKPDIIVSIPLDPVSTEQAYRKASAAGVKLVFMDSVPANFKAGTDYVSMVSGDNYNTAVAAADILAEAIGKKGEIGMLYYAGKLFATDERNKAFEKTIKEKYPDIKIVDRGGVSDTADSERVASAMLTKNPNMVAIWTNADGYAEGVVTAARTAKRDDLVVTTVGLGANVALSMAQGGVVKGIGALLPADQGIAEAILAAYSLLGKEVPPYVMAPGIGITKDNLLESWKTVYHADAPKAVQEVAK
jgi:ribose transport system substrate-binding protein